MERYALDVIGGLLDLGHDVVAFCRKADSAAPGMERLRDIRLIPSSFLPGKFRPEWFSWRLDSLRKTASLDAHIACGMVARPDVAVCGGTHRGYLAAMGKMPGFFDRRKIVLETAQYKNARVIVAHSRFMKNELVRLYGIAPERIHLIHPPVDASRFSPATAAERDALRADFGFLPGRTYFIFPSGSHSRKGLPFLREFFESTDLPVELVVAGRPAEPGKNIRSLGYVRDMERLYRAADSVVLAPNYEPFGLVGVESALCGTPVVLSANMGCCEVLAAPLLAVFRPGDAEDFRRAVREAIHFDRTRNSDPASSIRYEYSIRSHVAAILACL
jgi:glycosyltransferase involved in cell wall biosynthesis